MHAVTANCCLFGPGAVCPPRYKSQLASLSPTPLCLSCFNFFQTALLSFYLSISFVYFLSFTFITQPCRDVSAAASKHHSLQTRRARLTGRPRILFAICYS